MTWLQLINETGKPDLVQLFLQDKISKLVLAEELGNSRTDLVIQYKKEMNSKQN